MYMLHSILIKISYNSDCKACCTDKNGIFSCGRYHSMVNEGVTIVSDGVERGGIGKQVLNNMALVHFTNST